MGSEAKDLKQARLLNGIKSWGSDGIELEADQRHVEIALSELGLKSSKSESTPRTKDGESAEEDDEELGRDEARSYRGVAARLNFLAIDRPELQYSVKEARRAMATPTRGAWKMLRRIGRYLQGAPRLVHRFAFQELPQTLVATGDSDWAGCRRTRKSTSGGLLSLGGHVLKAWSSTQAVIALSLGLGLLNIAEDMNLRLGLELQTDSSAAKGISGRRGLGKTSHLAVAFLWLQERVRLGDLMIRKIGTATNPADLMTKHLSAQRIKELLGFMGYSVKDGRHEIAPRAAL